MANGFSANPIVAGDGSSGPSGETFNSLYAQLSQHVGDRFSGFVHVSSEGDLSAMLWG